MISVMTRIVPFAFVGFVLAAPVLAAQANGGMRDTDGVGKHTEVVDLSFAPGTALRLTVDSMCRKGKIVFRMKNDGTAWPAAANMQVVDADSGKIITARTLRLKANQSAGFSILPSKEAETLSLKIDAAWLPEAYEHSVGQSCK